MGRHSEPGQPIGRDSNIKEFEFDELFVCEPARLFVILGDILQWPERASRECCFAKNRREFRFLSQMQLAQPSRSTGEMSLAQQL